MPAPSPIFSACLPLASTMDVMRPATFHRGSFPTAVKSRLSGDWAPAGTAIHESATSHSFAFLLFRMGIYVLLTGYTHLMRVAFIHVVSLDAAARIRARRYRYESVF